MGVKGQKAWNKTQIDEADLIRRYQASRAAVREIAAEYGVSIQAIYSRLKSLGVKLRSGGDASIGTQAKEHNPNWKGGRYIGSNGYVYALAAGKHQLEHRVIAAQMLGRPLLKQEVVHHKNHVITDNRPENLEIIPSQSEHMKRHMTSDEARRRGKNGGWKRRAALKAVMK